MWQVIAYRGSAPIAREAGVALDVFIGYSRVDEEAAAAIQQYLTREGFDCYRDVTNIAGSEEWVKAITQAIRDCHVYVTLVSRNSVESDQVGLELTFGKKHKKPFVPVFLSRDFLLPDEVDYLLGNRQYIYAEPSLEAALPKVAEAVRRNVDRSRHKTAYEDEGGVRARATYHHEVDVAADTLGLPLGEFGEGVASARGRVYVLTSKPGHYVGSLLNALPVTSEFVVEAQVRRTAGPDAEWFGFEFGASWPGNYYQFLLDGRGALRIARHLDRVWTDLLCHEPLRWLQTHEVPNTLKVVRKEGTFHVFVNGLHAATVGDFEIRSGRPGLTLGRGITIEFAGLCIDGVSLKDVCTKALDYWNRLDTRQGRELLAYVATYEPAYKLPDMALDVSHMLLETRPDRRESVILAIGSGVTAQLHDRVPAERLREEINRKGRNHLVRWAALVTDTALLNETLYLECPVIAIGGPLVNKFTAIFEKDLPRDSAATERMSICHNMARADKRMAVWGPDAGDTSDAVELLIASGLLDRFLETVWTHK